MPREKVEFTFPDESEDDDAIVVEKSSAKTMGDDDFAEPSVGTDNDEDDQNNNDDGSDDFEVDIVDDTPEEDRGREPSEPPEEVSDEELERYSKKVRQRIQHFAKGYNDERRAKEAAFRERQELERVAKQLYEENQNLKGTVGKSQSALLDQAKRVVENDLNVAKTQYRDAYEQGDADALMKAEEALASARAKAERLKSVKPQSLQSGKDDIQRRQQKTSTEQEAPAQPAPPQPDPRAVEWAEKNSWFGQDDEMTSFALGYHQKLVKQGVDPTSDEYYEKVNSRMRQVFPEHFGEDEKQQSGGKTQKRSVVAPSTRSRAPKKVTLTKSQAAIAKRLGVSSEDYAKQLLKEMRKTDNG